MEMKQSLSWAGWCLGFIGNNGRQAQIGIVEVIYGWLFKNQFGFYHEEMGNNEDQKN